MARIPPVPKRKPLADSLLPRRAALRKMIKGRPPENFHQLESQRLRRYFVYMWNMNSSIQQWSTLSLRRLGQEDQEYGNYFHALSKEGFWSKRQEKWLVSKLAGIQKRRTFWKKIGKKARENEAKALRGLRYAKDAWELKQALRALKMDRKPAEKIERARQVENERLDRLKRSGKPWTRGDEKRYWHAVRQSIDLSTRVLKAHLRAYREYGFTFSETTVKDIENQLAMFNQLDRQVRNRIDELDNPPTPPGALV